MQSAPLVEEERVWAQGRRFLAFYQHAFSMNASRRSEEVTKNEASGAARPTFKVAPLDDEAQILSHLFEAVFQRAADLNVLPILAAQGFMHDIQPPH